MKKLFTLCAAMLFASSLSAQNFKDITVNGNCEGTDWSFFRVNDYVDGVKKDVAAPRFVADPADPTNHCIIVTTNAAPTYEWDAQFFVTIPESEKALNVGDEIKLTMRVKADTPQTAGSQAHGAPGAYNHWACVGDINFTTEWSTFTGSATVSGDMSKADNPMRTIAFNLSKLAAGNNCYFDDIKLEVKRAKKAEEIEWINLVMNSYCEGDDASSFTCRDGGGGGDQHRITDGVGVGSSRGIVVSSIDNPANGWDTQFFVTIPHAFQKGQWFKFKMQYRADKAATASTQAHIGPGEYKHWQMIGNVNFTTEWKTFEYVGIISSDQATSRTIAFNLNDDKNANKYYFDNIFFYIDADDATADDLAFAAIANAKDDEDDEDAKEVDPELVAIAKEQLQTAIDAAKGADTNGKPADKVYKYERALHVATVLMDIDEAWVTWINVVKDRLNAAVENLNKAEVEPDLPTGSYFIYNMGTGKYLAAGNSWGTRAIVNTSGLDYVVTMASDGIYTIDSQVSNGGESHYLRITDASKGEVYNDQPAQNWNIKKVSEGIFTISDGSNFLAAGDNEVVTLAGNGDAETAKWQFLKREDLLAAISNPDLKQPVELTGLIKDANFGRNDQRVSAWTMEAGNKNLSGGNNTNNCAESWCSTFTLSQEISVPNGIYEVRAQAALTDYTGAYDGADYPVVFANGESVPFNNMEDGDRGTSMSKLSESFSAGKYEVEPITVMVVDGTLKVGVKGTRTNTWCIWDNFRLYYTAPVPQEYYAAIYLKEAKAALADEIAVAEKLLAEVTGKKLREETKEVVAQAKVVYQGDAFTVIDCYNMIAELKAAEAAFVDAQKGKTIRIKDKADLADGKYYLYNENADMFWGAGNSWGTQASLVKHPEYVTLAKQPNGTYTMESQVSNGGESYFFNGDYMDQTPAMQITISTTNADGYAVADPEGNLFGYDGTSTVLGKKIDATEAALWEIISESEMLAKLAKATEEEPADATFLLLDPNFGRNNRNKAAWTGDEFSIGGDNTNMNAEKWGGNSQTFDISQTVDVPNGLYKITWNGFYRYNNTTDNTNDIAVAAHADGTEVINSFVYINGTDYALNSIASIEGALPFSQGEASAAFGKGLYAQSATVKVTDGKLTVGIKKVDHPGTDWTVWDNFVLYYYGNEAKVAGESVTAIQNVAAESTNGAIFNLQGQRVQKLGKGLYIIGNKKVMVK